MWVSPLFPFKKNPSEQTELKVLSSWVGLYTLSFKKVVPTWGQPAVSPDIRLKPGLLPSSVASFCKGTASLSFLITQRCAVAQGESFSKAFPWASGTWFCPETQSRCCSRQRGCFLCLVGVLHTVLSWPSVVSDFSHLVINVNIYILNLPSYCDLARYSFCSRDLTFLEQSMLHNLCAKWIGIYGFQVPTRCWECSSEQKSLVLSSWESIVYWKKYQVKQKSLCNWSSW